MKSRSAPLILVLVLSMVVAATAAGRVRSRRVSLNGDDWTPIPNVKDPHVQEMGNFAVAEYNKQTGESLKFKGVVSGEMQLVAGMNYRLILMAKNGGLIAEYEVVVYECPWENLKELTSFERRPWKR